MSTTCPSCGVAVVSGYVKCPKCGGALARRRLATSAAGGTAVTGARSFPTLPVLGAVIAIGVIVAVVATRGQEGGAKVNATPDETAQDDPDEDVERTPLDPDEIEAMPTPVATGPDPAEAARDLQRAIQQARLWGTVEVAAPRVDVRSGGCGDPAMGPLLDGATEALRRVGLTKLRCLEQSGRVVFERDL